MSGAALMFLFGAGLVGGQELPGTYRLMICSSPCAPEDSSTVVAEGHIVLSDSPDFLSELPDSAREKLTRMSTLYLFQSRVPNACFSIPTRQTTVNGRELYAGIQRRGLTHWTAVQGRLRVTIYQSPDAHYTLDGLAEGTRLTGKGEQGNCCGGRPPETSFFAERIGPPDAQVCLR